MIKRYLCGRIMSNMDIWDKEKRSAVMAKIRSKDTKPELIVRRLLVPPRLPLS